jgi:hypothetical protein
MPCATVIETQLAEAALKWTDAEIRMPKKPQPPTERVFMTHRKY